MTDIYVFIYMRGQGSRRRVEDRHQRDPRDTAPTDAPPGGDDAQLQAAPGPQREAQQQVEYEIDASGRLKVAPDALRERLHDSGKVSRGLLDIFRSCWFIEGSSWKGLKAEQKTFYWEEFKKKFWWDSIYPEQAIRDVFMRHAANRYKDTIHAMKSVRDNSVTDDIWAAWNAIWDTAAAKRKSAIARANRMSEPSGPGTGPVRHTAGSRSAVKHMTVLSQELGRPATYAELHVRMHSTKDDRNKFVDKRSQDKHERFLAERAAATQSSPAEGSSSTPQSIDENELFLSLEAVKKQRVYGVGSAAASYIASFKGTGVRRGSCSSSQQTHSTEDIEERIQREVSARVQGMREEIQRDVESSVDERIAERVRSELAKMMSTLPEAMRPPQPPSGPDDEDITRL
ncbi:uncharacterized protein LOC126686368 [Mercurialis annua]|uniref:uncharacterized protein LOC126686368 n=1 Tax=Mercurialis annua TaxID=3986 RepID=UPI0024AD42EA|nr:uncharacterized protein LOC126686368 [Mercurialis annua]